MIRCILSLSLSVQERVRLSWLPFVNDREEHSQWYCCVCVSVGRHFFFNKATGAVWELIVLRVLCLRGTLSSGVITLEDTRCRSK